MKCKYCNADIEQDAQFCPNCGKDLSKFNKCVKCGELLDNETAFCPHCGTEQPHEEIVEESTSSKKWFWIVGGILLIGVLAGGGYYFMGNRSAIPPLTYNQETDSIEEIVDSAITNLQSVEGIKARLDDILSMGMGLPDNEAVKKYFSKDYQETFFKVEEYDKKNIPEGEIGFWDSSIWGDGQGGIGNFHSVVKDAQNVSEKKATAVVEYVSDEYKGAKLITKFDLCFENGSWYIDEIIDDNGFVYKKEMKEYLDYWQKKQLIINAYANILNQYVKKGKKDKSWGNCYFLNDITGNGFSELWIQVEGDGDEKLNCQLMIYEYKDGAALKIFQESVGHPSHHSFVRENDKIYMSFGHMGEAQINIYEYKNGKVQTRVFKEGSDAEQSFGDEVESYEITDREHLSYL